MKNILGIFFLLILSGYTKSFAQGRMLAWNYDTLKIIKDKKYLPLDSIDVTNALPSSTLYGGGLQYQSMALPNDLFSNYQGGIVPLGLPAKKTPLYCGLPHLSFGYSFGNIGVQNASVTYQHAFTKKILLNANFFKQNGNGYLRNNQFRHLWIDFDLYRKAKTYSFVLNASFKGDEMQYFKGLTTDTLLEVFPLNFQPVLSSTAKSKWQHTKVYYQQYFNLLKDSIHFFGLTSFHQAEVVNRKYSESDTLAGIYGLVNYDSLNTKDQYQWGGINNGVGVYYKDQIFALEAGVYNKLWKIENLKFRSDSSEYNFYAKGSMLYKGFKFVASTDLNIIGAGRENRNALLVSYEKLQYGFNVGLNYDFLLPNYYQRQYFGNNFSYKLTKYDLQQFFNLKANAYFKYKKQGVYVGYTFQNNRNQYWFGQNSWRNDTLQHWLANSFKVKLDINWGILTFQPGYQFTLISEMSTFVPQHQLFARTFIKGSLFKAKKLKVYLGVDFQYLSAYDLIAYSHLADTYTYGTLNQKSKGYINLHAFTGFQIESFKFFFRFENLGYLFNPRTERVLENIPVPSTHFRFGITWDFYN